MTFVSFAPNFEDVMLWRALGDISAGFYVDVGATHPDAASVSRGFYERGWSGLNVTPLPRYRSRFEASRLRDTNLAMVLGAAPGADVLQVADDFSVATTDPDAGDALRAQGVALHQMQVSIETLTSLMAAQGQPDIHFLRIDAGGAERRVLAGFDFGRFRPWIVVVRAILPGSNAVTHQDWEPGLLAAGYVFVWFDGLSRFYVCEEHAARLQRHFTTPPNLFDDFVRSADTEWATRIATAESRVTAMSDRAEVAEAQAREDIRNMMELRVLNEHRIQQLRALEAERDAANIRAAVEAGRTGEARSWVEAIRRSNSWRLTGPLRFLTREIRRRRGEEWLPDALAPLPAMEPPALREPNFAAGPQAYPRQILPVWPRRSVHQFHPGTARGDAVTNAMLMIQGILRGLGYESEIYCEQPDPDVRGVLHPADELPRHGDYVLVVHFSLGFKGIDRITGLAAALVLMYHNITPPELLEGSPVLQGLARLGRDQLPLWRDRVAAGLAISEYNALELRAAGFPVALACPLLFDIDAMRATAAVPSLPRTDDVFTVLFVGRLVQSKAQHDLVAAFAVFRDGFQQPCRLVLVGRAQNNGDDYITGLRAGIAKLGLTSHVVLAGFVDDKGLRQAYHHADLYVSLSHHEGFGVPLVEAMAHDVPVLAWPCGAVPYTLDDAADLLTDRTPDAVAARMLALALDPASRQAIIRRQRRSLDRFRLAHHVPRLIQALALAGAAPPENPQTRPLIAENLRFTVMGHINGTYSLAAVNRGLARSIDAVLPGRSRIVAVEGQPTLDLSRLPAEELGKTMLLAARQAFETGPDIIISQHYPVYVPEARCDAALALFFWEESVIPLETVRVLNGHFRGVLAPSSFVAKTLLDSGVSIPVHLVGQSPDLAAFRRLGAARRDLSSRAGSPSGTVTFLHVSSCLPRKGVDILLAAYTHAFRRVDPVRLVIKGYDNPQNTVPAMVDAIRASDPDAPEIVLINHDLDSQALLDLYRTADVMVLPTRGEGFNLPAAEAMAARIPLIVTGFGGQTDFCDAGTARLLSSRFAPSISHLASGASLWVEPSMDDLVAAMREACAAPGSPDAQIAAARVRAAAARIETTLNDATFVAAIVRAAASCVLEAPVPPPRIAWITTWDVRCGVAEYSRHLLDAWPGESGDVTVLACDRTMPDADAPQIRDGRHQRRVRIGWRLRGEGNVRNLSTIVAQEDPAVLVIQHQPGLLSWKELALLLRAPAIVARTICVTLHATKHLDDIDPEISAEAATALRGVARVIVHTIADLEQLKRYGLSHNVVMMPHGVPLARKSATPRLVRNLPAGSAPVVGCYGFFLPGKGIGQLIEAAVILRETWPGLRLRLVNAIYDLPHSTAEIATCRAIAEAVGIADSIDWNTAFLPEAESRALLEGCDVVVLPYQSSQESSSAALRSVLASRVPVAVTPLEVFDDAEYAIARLPGFDPRAIAIGIAALLHDDAARTRLLETSGAYAVDRSWGLIAERMLGLLSGLARTRI